MYTWIIFQIFFQSQEKRAKATTYNNNWLKINSFYEHTAKNVRENSGF